MRGLPLVVGVVLSFVPLAVSTQSPSAGEPTQAASPRASPPPTHVTLKDRPWTSSEQYPEALRRVYRYKALIGGRRPGVIPQSDVLMGMLELAPGATYPAHRFEPRASGLVRNPVVWAIDAAHLCNYLVPRECPRVTYYAGRASAAGLERVLLGRPERS